MRLRTYAKMAYDRSTLNKNGTRNIFKKDNWAQKKWTCFYWPFQRSASVLFVSCLPLLYCLYVPYSLVVAGRVRVDLSALLWVMFPCVFVSLSYIVSLVRSKTLNCIDSWSLLSAVESLIMSADKKLLLILHVITKEIEYNILHFIYMLLWNSLSLEFS